MPLEAVIRIRIMNANFQAFKNANNNQLATTLSQITPESIQALNENYNAVTAGFWYGK